MKPTSAQIVWRKYLAEKINEDEYNGKNIYITSEELTLEDIPDSTESDEKAFNFVRTYVPVRDRFDHHLTYLSLYYKDYVYEGKHKDSIQKLRGVMYFIIAILSIGIAYYLFLATPQQKAEMDKYANQFANSIYHVNINKIQEMINEAKAKIEAAKAAAQQKIAEAKKSN